MASSSRQVRFCGTRRRRRWRRCRWCYRAAARV